MRRLVRIIATVRFNVAIAVWLARWPSVSLLMLKNDTLTKEGAVIIQQRWLLEHPCPRRKDFGL